LGTDVFLEIVLGSSDRKEKAKKDLEKTKNFFFAKEKIFSRFDPTSEISKLNRNLFVWQTASADVVYLSGRALRYNETSGGLYDPRVIGILEKIGYKRDFRSMDFFRETLPEDFKKIAGELTRDLKIRNGKVFFRRRMDFSGIAKGYIVDRAAEFLKKSGWQNFLIDAGGDMQAVGLNSEGEKWRIAVEGIPEEKLMLEISNRGIATSGISRKKWTIAGKKFLHLVNPKNPNRFSWKLRTVSVISQNTEKADGRAKVLVLMGKKAGLEFAEKNKIPAVFLDYKGNVLISSEAEKYILSKK